MSESDSANEPVLSDSFWEVDCYKRTVRRTEDGLQSCHDLVKMCQERADIEKEYAKKLKSWSKKWTDFHEKGSEYGSTKGSIKSSLEEADKIADIHLTIRERLATDIQQHVKEWKNENYKKQMVGNCRESKQFEDDFKKAQKPWKSRYNKVVKARKDFHNACKLEKSALIQENNAKNSSDVSVDQLRKFQERVDKCKKEAILTKERYEQHLMELNAYKGRYIEDMADVFQKTQDFEEKRLHFIKAIFFRLHSSLNLSSFQEIPRIYASMNDNIACIDPGRDLKWWSFTHGPDMSMTWPTFEEYSTELHSITNKSSKNNEAVVALTYMHRHDNLQDNSTYLNSAEVTQMSHGNNTSHNRASLPSITSVTSSNRSSQLNSIPEDETDIANRYSDNYKNKNNSTTNNVFNNSNNGKNNTNNNSNNGTVNIKVRALYDYEGREKDELTLRVGEVFMKVRERDEQGWCTGMKGDIVGLYPDNYVELLTDNPF